MKHNLLRIFVLILLISFMAWSCSDDPYYGELDWTTWEEGSSSSSSSDDSDSDDSSTDDSDDSSTDDDDSSSSTSSGFYYRSIIFDAGDLGYYCFRIPTIVKTAQGTLLAFVQGRKNDSEDEGDIDLYMKRSTDSGNTWSSAVLIADDDENKCGGCVAVALESGRVVLLWNWNVPNETADKKTYYTYSDDDGLTWSESVDITDSILGETEYRLTMGPCHGIQKQYEPNKGRIIVPARCADSGSRSSGPSHVIYSDDEGETWQKGGFSDFKNGNEVCVTELLNGNVLINMRNANTSVYYRYQDVSEDGGESFTGSWMTSLYEQVTGCQGSILTYGANADTGDSIVLFSNPNHTSSRRYGSIKVSVDNGYTWTKNYQYVPTSGEWMYSGYSDMVMLDDGTIGVMVENGRTDQGTGRIAFIVVDYDDIVDDFEYQ